MTDEVVIVGGGLAAALAVQTLREEGFTAPVTMLCAEPDRPYERPPLSKAYLMRSAERESVFVHPADWYETHNVTLLTGVRATALDPTAHVVQTSEGARLAYSSLLLATGSTPRPLSVPGADLDGVRYLRTLADCDALAARLVAGARVVVIGGGWIGLEVAAAARTAQAEVTVVEAADRPLQRVLGPVAAQVFVDLHTAHGVRILTNASVRELRGAGRVESVVLADSTELPADVVVVGIGALPNVDLAVAAGIEVTDGVATDASLRTSAADVYAAGDIANVRHPVLGRYVRVEHWANARETGATAAKAMLGQPVTYDRMPYFYTDQYDLGMEYRGYAEPGAYDRVIVRGSLAVVDGHSPTAVVFWTKDSRVLAAMNINSWDDGPQLEQLVHAGHSGRSVDLDRLANPDVPFDDLL